MKAEIKRQGDAGGLPQSLLWLRQHVVRGAEPVPHDGGVAAGGEQGDIRGAVQGGREGEGVVVKHTLRWSKHGNCWRVTIPNWPDQYFFDWGRACRFLLHSLSVAASLNRRLYGHTQT